MPQLCNSKPSSVRSTNSRNRRNSSCWRNPCVVFLITFGILFTLRFRTPTKKAATKLLNKQQQISRGKQLLAKSSKQISVTASESEPVSTEGIMSLSLPIVYNAMEEGTHMDGAAFIKYQAVDSTGAPVSLEHWAQAMAAPVAAENATPHASDSLTTVIQSAPYKAVYFETPPANMDTFKTKKFEFVLVDAPRLASFADGNPDPMAFASQFESCVEAASACAFENLGKDALLVVPKPLLSSTDATAAATAPYYGHLASFVRDAPSSQVRSVWSLVGSNLLQRYSDRGRDPVWLSTSGTGVAWLHLRLDARPKYYTHDPYKTFPKDVVVSTQLDM